MIKSYNINTLTQEQLKDLIANADDNYDNQIRVKENGQVYISNIVGAEDIEGLRFKRDMGTGVVSQSM